MQAVHASRHVLHAHMLHMRVCSCGRICTRLDTVLVQLSCMCISKLQKMPASGRKQLADFSRHVAQGSLLLHDSVQDWQTHYLVAAC